MKWWKWLKWLLWNLMALWTMSELMGKESADGQFDCIYKRFCHKRTFDYLRRCWLILASETKSAIQQCAMSTCKLHLPEFYSEEDLCGNNISYDKKKECFFVCLKKFVDYVIQVETKARYSYSSTYQSLVHSKDCTTPVLEVCSHS